MKNIVVPVDFSEYSTYAFNAGINLAKKHKSTLHLIHSIKSVADVIQVDTFASGDFASSSISTDQVLALLDMKKEQAENGLAELKKKAINENIQAITYVEQASIQDSINTICDEIDIDLIIMGSHGSSGLSEMFIGSNAQKVVRYTKVPVLILKEEMKGDLDDIVYASNFEEDEINKNIPRASSLSKMLGAQMHFLFVNTPGYFEDSASTLAKMELACTTCPDSLKHIYNDFSVEDGVIAFSNLNNMDAICITTHGYKALRRFFNNNIVEHLVNHCKRPILSLHIRD